MLRTSRLILGASLALAISALSMTLIVRSVSGGDWLGSILGFGSPYLALCLVLLAASWMSDAMRLRVLGRALGRELSFGALVATIMMGNFLTLSTPFMAGGAPAIVYSLHRQGLLVGEASAVVVIGGLASQLALAGFNLWSAVTLVAQLPPGAWIGRAYLGLVAVYFLGLGTFLWLALRAERARSRLGAWLGSERMRPWLARLIRVLLDMLADFRSSILRLMSTAGRIRMAQAVGWAAVYFLLYFSVGIAVMRGLGVAGSTVTLFAWQVVAATIALFTPSPGGSGAAEFGAMLSFGGLLPAAILPAFIILWRFFTFHVNLLLGGVAMAFLATQVPVRGGINDE